MISMAAGPTSMLGTTILPPPLLADISRAVRLLLKSFLPHMSHLFISIFSFERCASTIYRSEYVTAQEFVSSTHFLDIIFGSLILWSIFALCYAFVDLYARNTFVLTLD